MQYHYFENYTKITFYDYYAIQIQGKKCTPSLFLQIFGQFTLKWLGLATNVHIKQRKTIFTQTLQFHVKFICMPCWFSIYCRDRQPL